MTNLIYQLDSYIQAFEAKVIQVDLENHGLILDQTVFFPGGGGQPTDIGFLMYDRTRYLVSRARKIGSDVLHLLDGDGPLPPTGTVITGQIDWNRRYQLMRTHTAMHVLCGVIFRDYGAQVTGGDMDPLQGRMDFEFETMRRELVEEIQSAINHEVTNARDVRVNILPRAEAFQIPDLIRTKINLLPECIQEVRVVEIVGLDLQADGGTHVKNTSEVGNIRVTDYKSKGRINKRIYVELSEQ